MVARGWVGERGREWEMTANEYGVAFWGENVLELDSDDGYTTL